MPEQIEQVKREGTPKINMAINSVDNGYVIQAEVQYMCGDAPLGVERRSAVAMDTLDVSQLVSRFMLHRSFELPKGTTEPEKAEYVSQTDEQMSGELVRNTDESQLFGRALYDASRRTTPRDTLDDSRSDDPQVG